MFRDCLGDVGYVGIGGARVILDVGIVGRRVKRAQGGVRDFMGFRGFGVDRGFQWLEAATGTQRVRGT